MASQLGVSKEAEVLQLLCLIILFSLIDKVSFVLERYYRVAFVTHSRN